METEEMMKDTVGKKQKRKKILLIGIIVALLLGVAIWAIQVIPVANYYKEDRGNAKEFVSDWNTRSDESDPLTNGVKISAASGEHVYSLGNGVTLKYTINSYWWVKYLAAGVVLEFSEEEQESVYELSRSFLELFDEIEDKDGMFASELEEVEPEKPTVISKFVVLNSSGEYSINLVEAEILKSNSVTGYSWNLTMEEWCENFNSNLEFAIDDALKNACSYLSEITPLKQSDKDELAETCAQQFPPISVSDFRKGEVWTDGTHEFTIYVYRYPSWDTAVSQISLFVDENGYVFDVECLVTYGMIDMVNQYCGGDRRMFFMEFYGYPALVGTGTGVRYSKSLDGVNKFYFETGLTTINLTDMVSVGVVETKDGFVFIYLPNKEENFENCLSRPDKWTLIWSFKSAE